MLFLLWHICYSLDKGFVKIDARWCNVSHSFYSCAFRTGWCHFRVNQSICVIDLLKGFHMPYTCPPQMNVWHFLKCFPLFLQLRGMSVFSVSWGFVFVYSHMFADLQAKIHTNCYVPSPNCVYCWIWADTQSAAGTEFYFCSVLQLPFSAVIPLSLVLYKELTDNVSKTQSSAVTCISFGKP